MLGGDEEERASGLAYGQVHSTEEGDPIDVLADAGDEPDCPNNARPVDVESSS